MTWALAGIQWGLILVWLIGYVSRRVPGYRLYAIAGLSLTAGLALDVIDHLRWNAAFGAAVAALSGYWWWHGGGNADLKRLLARTHRKHGA